MGMVMRMADRYKRHGTVGGNSARTFWSAKVIMASKQLENFEKAIETCIERGYKGVGDVEFQKEANVRATSEGERGERGVGWEWRELEMCEGNGAKEKAIRTRTGEKEGSFQVVMCVDMILSEFQSCVIHWNV